MPRIEVETVIHAPVTVVFELSRSIDLHVETQSRHGERAVAGCTTGLIAFGESVTWEARHFGVKQRLCSRIVAMDPPRHFRDSMVSGAFKRFDHDHFFDVLPDDGGTVMRDVFDFNSPLGPLGRLVDTLVMTRHMTMFLIERNQLLKSVAESGDYQRFLTP